jgi:hypothetical protein
MKASALAFSDDQQKALYLKKMAEHCVTQFSKIKGKLKPTIERMNKYSSELDGDFRHRVTGKATDIDIRGAVNEKIFDRSNFSLSVTRGQVRYIVSKTFDEMFGSRPWMAVKPIGLNDVEKARDLQKYCEHKFNDPRANVEPAIKDACLSAWGMGYGILKTSYLRKVEEFDTVIDVLLDESGEPILGISGRPITSSSPNYWNDKEDGYVFEDDPEKRAFKNPQFSEITSSDYAVKYNGPELACVSYKDFIADPDSARLEDCDFVSHHQAWTVGELKKEFGLGMIDPDKYDQILDSAGLNKVPSVADADPFSTPDSTGQLWGKRDNANFINVAECYFNYERPGETDEDGNVRPGDVVRMFALVALDSQEVIWADYLGNVTPQADLPFTVITCDKGRNSWTGAGFLQRFDQEQQFIDECFNQIKVRNDYAANPIVIIDRKAFQEGETGKSFEWGPGLHKELRGNAVASEAVQVMPLPQMENETRSLMDTVIQMITMDSGVSGAAQGDVGALPQLNTATGVKQVLGHGSILNKMSIREVQRGVETAIFNLTKLMLNSMDPIETVHFFEGENEVEAIIDRDDFNQLELDVRLTLTKFHQDEEESRLMRVMMTVERYLALPVYAMEKARALFIDQLRILGVEDAENKLPLAQEVAMAMAPPETEPTEEEINEAAPPLPINEEEQLDDEAVDMIKETEAEPVV